MVSDRLLIAPGERADLIVDFTSLAVLSFILSNGAQAPYPGRQPRPADHPETVTLAQSWARQTGECEREPP